MPESGSEYAFEHSTDERKQKLLGVAATNDEAESVLGGATAAISSNLEGSVLPEQVR